MTEITCLNFETYYPQIVKSIDNAHFIAVDTEFSGLNFSEKPNLSDTLNQRYLKLRKSVKTYNLTQIGISAFRSDPTKKNVYIAETYYFYLFPKSYNVYESTFSIQASTFEFLAKYNFDFNKYINAGVSFINNQQETLTRKKLEKQYIFAGIERDVDERQIQIICSNVTDWLLKANDNSFMILSPVKGVPNYIIHKEIRFRFEDVWTKNDKDKKIKVYKVKPEDRAELDKNSREDEINEFIDEILGFTKVFRLLVKCKKPIIGHNMVLDLMYMYEKFYESLPDDVNKFKTNLNELFPIVYDTKYISMESRNKLGDLYSDTTLQILYNTLNKEKSKAVTGLYAPIIKQSEETSLNLSEINPHQAGYDAYMTGNIFLRLASILSDEATKNDNVFTMKAFKDHISNIKELENKIFLMKSPVNHMNLIGPEISIPNLTWLYVKSKQGNLEFFELIKAFSSHGNCEVKLKSKSHAFVACSKLNAEKILVSFRNNQKYLVYPYSILKHSPILKYSLWSGLAIASATICYSLFSRKK